MPSKTPDSASAAPGQTRDPGPGSALQPEACIFRHVVRTSRAIAATWDPALAVTGLTGHQFNLMMTLRQMGPLTVGKLAASLGMDPSGIPRAIRPLTETGLVDVSRGEDRRQRVLGLTEAGEDRLEQAMPHWQAIQSQVVSRLGAARWAQLSEDLRALRRAAQGPAAEEISLAPRHAAE